MDNINHEKIPVPSVWSERGKEPLVRLQKLELQLTRFIQILPLDFWLSHLCLMKLEQKNIDLETEVTIVESPVKKLKTSSIFLSPLFKILKIWKSPYLKPRHDLSTSRFCYRLTTRNFVVDKNADVYNFRIVYYWSD